MAGVKPPKPLRARSITDLRAIAQGMSVPFTFADDVLKLAQKIEMKQTEVMPPPPPIVVETQGDQRLRTLPPSRVSSEEYVWAMLKPFIERGLYFDVDANGFWEMKRGEKTDCGNLRCPPRAILRCAERLMV